MHHLVTYTPISASWFREYFDQNVQNVPGDTSRTGAGRTVHVPSSRRPDAPLLRYVVPAFGWQRDETTNLRASRRLGGTLRVFLDRPWWSSGDGELLGVLTQPHPLPPDRQDQLSKFVSRIGSDPVYAAWSLVTPLMSKHFTAAVARERDLSLAELPRGDTVDVAGHKLLFDSARPIDL
jgi:hypothetical protein